METWFYNILERTKKNVQCIPTRIGQMYITTVWGCLYIYIYYIYLLRTRSTLHIIKGQTNAHRKKGRMQTHHDVMLATQWLFTTETRLLHLEAGNVNKDICNFICGETRKIIVHELFNRRTLYEYYCAFSRSYETAAPPAAVRRQDKARYLTVLYWADTRASWWPCTKRCWSL